MVAGQAPMSLARVRSQLGSVLKSDIAVDVPACTQPQNGSFRSFVSRAISVIDVQGGAISLRKSVSLATDVHLLCMRRGSAELAHAEGCTLLEAGQFVAYGGAQAIQFSHEQDIDLQAVFLPGSAIERWLPDWQAAEFVAAQQQADVRLSFDIAHNLLDSAEQLQDSSAPDIVGEAVVRLIARALAATSLCDASAPKDLADARRRKVRRFCRKHLSSPNLSVEVVARGTGLSRAAIHRLFSDQAHTLMQWVQLERLDACRLSLSEQTLPKRTLTDIALAHGFKSSAHFSAAFRQQYGQSPRDYRVSLQSTDPTLRL